MALLLTESEVTGLLSMPDAVAALETVFRKQAMTEVSNVTRGRARTDHGLLHVMGAAVKSLGVMACKVYTTTRTGSHFLVHLYDGKSGDLLAIMQADQLGRVRTGATAAVATKLLARKDATTVGVFGSGRQARTQLLGMAAVRPLTGVKVYSPDPQHRRDFAERMTVELGMSVEPVQTPEQAADADIVCTATDAVEPFLQAEWLRPGTHVNAVGSNFVGKAELTAGAVGRCDLVVVDDKEQARQEAGDITQAVEADAATWVEVAELGNVVVRRVPGRETDEAVTLFKSVGVAYEDLAVAKLVYDRAVADGVGGSWPNQ